VQPFVPYQKLECARARHFLVPARNILGVEQLDDSAP
jgi:hypothetical protein